LKRLASGEILGSFCLTEAAAGSDAAGIQATATRSTATLGSASGCYRLNGAKTWVTNGSDAGVYIVFAKTDPRRVGRESPRFSSSRPSKDLKSAAMKTKWAALFAVSRNSFE